LSTYLVADGRHGAADRCYAKHGDGNNETDDLDKRHPVREERPEQRRDISHNQHLLNIRSHRAMSSSVQTALDPFR